MLDRPFSDVCSTVSCWALLFSVILPSMQLMGLEVTAITAAAVSPSSIKSPSTTSSSSSSASSISYAFTVYLDPSTSHSLQLPSTLSISFLANPDLDAKESALHDNVPSEIETQEQDTSTKKRAQVLRTVPRHSKQGQQQIRTRAIWIEAEAELEQRPTPKDTESKDAADPVVASQMEQTSGMKHLRFSRQRNPNAKDAIQQLYDSGRSDLSFSDEAHFDGVSEGRDVRDNERANVAKSENPWRREHYRRRQDRQEMVSYSFADRDDTATPSSSSSAATRREVMISRKQIWKGHATVVAGTTGTKQQDVTRRNGSESIRVLHDTLSGPLVTISFLATTLPAVPFQWIALVPCTLQNTLDRQLISQLSADAVILHSTLESDCSEMLESPYPKSSPMILSMDTEPAEQLLYSLDDLTPELTPMGRLSKVVPKPRRTSLKPARIVFEAEETVVTTASIYDSKDTRQRQQGSSGGLRTSERDDSIDDTDASTEIPESPSPSFLRQRFPQEKTQQVVISLPEIASIVNSFKTGAAIQARRVLINLGLKSSSRRTQVVRIHDRTDEESDSHHRHDRTRPQRPQPKQPATLVTTAIRTLSNSLFIKHDIKTFKSRLENLDLDDESLDEGYDTYDELHTLATALSRPLSRIAKAEEAQTESELRSGPNRHPKVRARPNRQMARVQSNSAAQVLEDVSSLVLLKDSIYQQYLHHHLHGSHLQHQNPHVTDYLESKGVIPTNISGKLAVVLMSTVCGVGVGMFGALLVVVALKVRLFSSRRASNGLNNVNQGTAAQQQAQQEHGLKKVLSKSTLDSFGIQTVVKTGEGTMLVASSRSTGCCSRHCRHHKSHAKKRKAGKEEKLPERTQLNPQSTELGYSGRLTYAEDIIDMESGLEDQEAQQDARLQRQQRRVRIVSAQAILGMMTNNMEEDRQGGDEHVDNHTGYQVDYTGLLQDYRDEDENEGEGLDTAVTTELDRIATTILATSRHGSYRRVSYSRQGHRNNDWHRSSGSFSLSSSTSTLHSSSLTIGSLSTLADSNLEASSSSLSLSISLSLSNDRRGDKPLGCMAANEDDCIGDSGVEDVSDLDDGGADDMEEEETDLPFANANAQTMCAVCLAEYELGDQVRTLPCFHQYHQSCIDPWLLQVAALCPICKRDLLQSPTPPSCP